MRLLMLASPILIVLISSYSRSNEIRWLSGIFSLVEGAGAGQVFEVLGAACAPERNPFAAEIDAIFRRQPADRGFGLLEEGAVERVFADDGAGGGGDPGAGKRGHGREGRTQCSILTRDSVLLSRVSGLVRSPLTDRTVTLRID